MALGDDQKSFYDTRRQFQGHDNPDVPPAPPLVAGGIALGQVAAGLLFLGVILLGFFLFTRPSPDNQLPPTATTPATAAH